MNNIEFIEITNDCQSMAVAAKKTGMSYRNFRKKAIDLNCFNPNQSGKGTSKKSGIKIPLDEILGGSHPQYQSYKLKKRLILEGIFADECSVCEWGEKPEGADITPCELDHIDGNPLNHELNNLRILCPNCHSLTKTYRFRRGRTNFEHQDGKPLE